MLSIWLLLLCLSAVPARAEPALEAPFGLDWGIPASELKPELVASRRAEGRMEIIDLTALPGQPPDSSAITLIFDSYFGLQRIIWRGESQSSDADGQFGRLAYNELRRKLATQMGSPARKIEESARHRFTRPDQFYECLKDEKCGSWHALWQMGGQSVMLELVGAGPGTGYLRITWEGPRWPEALHVSRMEQP